MYQNWSLPLFLSGLLFLVTVTVLDADPTVEDVNDYLSEMEQRIQAYHVSREDISREELIQGAHSALIARMDDPEFHGFQISDGFRQALERHMRDRRFTDRRPLITALRNAVDESSPSADDLTEVADVLAGGMLEATGDPYSRLMTLEELMQLQQRMDPEGSGRGSGIRLRTEGKSYRVMYVTYGSPAYRAGIQPGDQLVSIDGKEITGLPQQEVMGMLTPAAGEPVKIRIKRDPYENAHFFLLRPNVGGGSSVTETALLPGNIGYVRLTRFSLNASDALESAFSELREQGAEKFILDLRNNPGGALQSATSIVDQFLPEGHVITRTESEYDPTDLLEIENPILKSLLKFVRNLMGGAQLDGVERSTDEVTLPDQPLVVLVNEASASASELTAGALQDTDRATLVGRTTLGKGVGQTIVPLSSTQAFGDFMQDAGPFAEFLGLGSRVLALTVMEYYLPSDRSIHEIGVTPDVRVADEPPSEEIFSDILALRNSDILHTYIQELMREEDETAEELARYDGYSGDRYPGYDAFVQKVRENLDTNLEPDSIRREVRRGLRMSLTQRDGTPFIVDLQEDPILQTGVLELDGGEDE